MSAPTSHILAGVAYYAATTPSFAPRRDWKFLVGLSVLSILPDLDFLPVFFIGFENANNLHHTYSHTVLFAVIVSLVIGTLLWRLRGGLWTKRVGMIGIIMGSHLLIDYLTKDTRPPIGTKLLWPFSDALFNSPISIFQGVAKKNLASVISWYNVMSMSVDVVVVGTIIVAILLLRGFIPIPARWRLSRE